MPRSIFFAALLLPFATLAGDLNLRSGPAQVHLLELYTSEGCSSCPPAEEHLSTLTKDPGLWTSIVPVAFHIDYWNNLGWTDRFSSPAFSQRQQSYATSWGTQSIYTPEFILDGREFQSGDIPAPSGSAGILSVSLHSGRQLSIHYQPSIPSPNAAWSANVATLGFGLESNVRAGENSGRHLRHDFVVLSLATLPLHSSHDSITLPVPKPGEKAIAVWITQAGSLTPVQAVGGWIN